MQEYRKVQYLDRFYLTLINDLFVFVSSSNLSNYADDITLYASGFNLEEVKKCLSTDLDAVTTWFYENHMTFNARKCHFKCLGKDTRNETFIFKGLVMKNIKEQKVIGVTIDNKLTFKSHIKNLCKKSLAKNRGFIKAVKSSK